MKKFMQIVTATILSLGFIGSVASAATTAPCTGDVVIHNSGNGNNSTISCENIKDITITCENNVTVGNINLQGAESGSVVVSGNESGGNGKTGTVTNSNNTTTNLGVTGCAGTTEPTTTPTPSVTPVTPGKGAIEGTVVSLPNTASNNTATIIAVSLASAAAVVGLSRAGVAAYRRIGNK